MAAVGKPAMAGKERTRVKTGKAEKKNREKRRGLSLLQKARGLLFLLLALALLLPTGCGKNPSGQESGGESRPQDTPQTEPDAYTSTLPDFSGEGFVVVRAGDALSAPAFSETGWSRERTARLLNTMEERGVSVGESEMSAAEIYRRLSDAALAETDFADLLLLPASQVGRFAAAGLLQDLSALPFFSVESEGIDPAGTEAFTLFQKTWALSGGALYDPASLGCVGFDLHAAEEAGLDLFALSGVSGGEGVWTADTFAAAAKVLGGFSCQKDEKEAISAFFSASGLPGMSASQEEDYLAEPTERELALTDALHALFFGDDSVSLGFSVEENASLFLCDLSAALTPDTGSTRLGILPMPAAEGGYTPVFGEARVAAVPAACRYPEKTALLLSAMMAAGGDAEADFLRWCLDHCVSSYEQYHGIVAVLSAPRCWDPALAFAEAAEDLGTVTVTARLNSVERGLHSRLSAWKSYAAAARENLRQAFGG